MTACGSVEETLGRYVNAGKEEWRLIPRHGTDELEEIYLTEIPPLITSEFLIALRYWKRYHRYGLPVHDWRDLTLGQERIIEICDDLYARRKEK